MIAGSPAGSAAILHATTLARRCAGGWRGVLVRGPSGAGKSDFALRALSAGWRLVADDRTLVWASGGEVFARAPSTIAGLIEARGVGVLRAPSLLPAVRLALVLGGVGPDDALERLPDPETAHVLHAELPCLRLRLAEASAVSKVELALASRGSSL